MQEVTEVNIILWKERIKMKDNNIMKLSHE